MANGQGRAAPYGPSVNVIEVIRRHRDHGVPDPLTQGELLRLGIPEGNTGRTHAALKFLDLIDDNGQHTAAMGRLSLASTDDYPGVLADILRVAYRDIFQAVGDVSTATDTRISDAFRGFSPPKQRGRMAMLFKGLCREAGLVAGEPVSTLRRKTDSRPSAKAPVRRTPPPQPSPGDEVNDDGHQAHSSMESMFGTSYAPKPTAPQDVPPDYRLLQAVLTQLPKNGKWTRSRRDQWLNALTVNVDLLVHVVDENDMQSEGERRNT